jgi:hypothetical protein
MISRVVLNSSPVSYERPQMFATEEEPGCCWQLPDRQCRSQAFEGVEESDQIIKGRPAVGSTLPIWYEQRSLGHSFSSPGDRLYFQGVANIQYESSMG